MRRRLVQLLTAVLLTAALGASEAAERPCPPPPVAAPDAPAVTVTNLAATVASNYAACLDDQSRLKALQEIIKTLVEK